MSYTPGPKCAKVYLLMGNRSRWAALGVTCSLLVAACATTNSPLANSPELSSAPRPAAAQDPGVTISFPESLANASFIQPDTSADSCRAEHPPKATVLSAVSGEELWSFPIPEPGKLSVVNPTKAFITFRADRGQAPGLGALDLETHSPAWQRFFETEIQDLQLSENALIVATRDAIRAVDPETGDDLWVCLLYTSDAADE